MKATLRARLESLGERLQQVSARLAAEDATRDMEAYRRLAREHAELSHLAELWARYRQAERDATAAREMAADPAMKAFAEEELKAAEDAMRRLEGELRAALLPRDPNDERNVFLEIRAGTGGEESALFAADLFRMYTRYAERRGWQVELVSESPSDLGGYKEVIARIVGPGAYARLKF
ncbi:MAG: PCRF domain-containing protein, partial [Dehalococcoidia bacterium]|nr:PCRF domain-containing protein [Dehalococcoidia bacterium]